MGVSPHLYPQFYGSFVFDQLTHVVASNELTECFHYVFDTEHVTLDAICLPHWEQTRKTKPGRYLLISDTTDLNFTWHTSTKGLGMLGDGKGRGIQLHPCLVFSLDENQVVGLAGAVTHYRAFKPKNETRFQSLARNRESDIWGKIVDKVGTAPEGINCN